ncbi:hypothetical protein SAMN05428949_2747 [Chitinophaga sp. YR627]|uniref:hypothetical protein n=1 Tax=Chitinophaga sp. YR627 TaxID=1881041 RepID=UPI0008DF59AA|nr:hypothetical protein [Chitinophaga sp. YR627]SFN41183.1 hypothetical protein SAMN05428949_2747 [Chitinophaga sp. YR627]
MIPTNYIYSADPGLTIGFHGCSQELRDEIINGKTALRQSNNPWDWLGDGIYFWQNNYERAFHYANNPPPNLKINDPAVLGAVFSLGNCLDLTDKKYIDLLQDSFNILNKSALFEGKQLPENTNHPEPKSSNDKVLRRLDCAVIKKIHTQAQMSGQPPFDSVRCVFPEGNEVYKGAGFLDKTHIQICIRNPNLIKGYFIPRKETIWPSI